MLITADLKGPYRKKESLDFNSLESWIKEGQYYTEDLFMYFDILRALDTRKFSLFKLIAKQITF